MREPAAGPKESRRVGLADLVPHLRGRGRLLAGLTVLSLVSASAYLSQPLLIKSVLDRIAAGEPFAWAVALLVTLLFGAVIMFATRDYLLHRVAEGIVLTTRWRLAGHLLRLPIAEYDKRRTGDLLSRVSADTTLLRAVITQSLVQLVTEAVILVGAFTLMIYIDPLMAVVTAVVLTGVFGGMLVARLVRGASEQAQGRVGAMTADLERALTAVRTIRAAGAEDRETSAIGGSARAAYHAGVRMAKLQALVLPATAIAFQGGVVAVLAIGGARVATGNLGLSDLVAFVMLMFQLMLPINLAMNAYTQLQAGLGALQRIEDVLSLPAEGVADPPATVAEPVAAAPAIQFDRVSFAYSGGPPVLHDVSFTVPYGTRTALVGPSGAGKSTLFSLVERFYDATDGTVRVAGVDVRDQPRSQLRANLGYVEQEAPVLAGTIRDNLLIAAPDADDAAVLAALASVNLADLVERTPEGLDAQVGEAGVLLSGGERQRLAIARALLADTPILLLDEPTSNLDARNEQALRQAIDAAGERRTLLIVAHRLATVVDADQIVVLDQGRVVAAGRHDELAELSPLYREFAVHQMLVAGSAGADRQVTGTGAGGD